MQGPELRSRPTTKIGDAFPTSARRRCRRSCCSAAIRRRPRCSRPPARHWPCGSAAARIAAAASLPPTAVSKLVTGAERARLAVEAPASPGVTSVAKAAMAAAPSGAPPPSAMRSSTVRLPPSLRAASSWASPCLAQPGGLVGEAAIDQGLDPVRLRQPKPDGGAEIGRGTGRLAQLAIGDAAEIERLGGVAGRNAVGIDGGGELAHGGVVFAGGKRGGAVLEPGILGVRGAGSGKQGKRGGQNQARGRPRPPKARRRARKNFRLSAMVLLKQRNRANPRLLVYSTVTDLARLRG